MVINLYASDKSKSNCRAVFANYIPISLFYCYKFIICINSYSQGKKKYSNFILKSNDRNEEEVEYIKLK